MYAIYAYIDPQNHPNVGIYAIHGVSGTGSPGFVVVLDETVGDRSSEPAPEASETADTVSEQVTCVLRQNARCICQIERVALKE